LDALLANIRESFGRAVYSHKIHEKERELQSRLSTVSKWLNVALGAVTLGGLVVALTQAVPWALWLSTVVGTVNVGYMLAQLTFDPLGKAALHRAAAKQLLGVRNGYQTLIADLEGGFLTADEARVKRDELEVLAQEAYRLAPDTSNWAYKQAQRSLKVGEDMTFSTAEIDAFLPEQLRRGSD
jgi:hypothetical protein